MDPGLVLQALLGHPNLASRAWVTTQYDATVGADTLAGSGLGAATLRVKGTTKGLVMATDACERIGAIDPWLGAAMAVAECSRNVSITGARPLGVTNCLNFGNPERPEAFWQLQEAVRGLGDACRALGLPVTGGNVSLYNESLSGAIPPTTQIGVVGLLDDISMRVGPAFRGAGDVIGLLGEAVPGLAGSVYAELAGSAPDDRPPALDLGREAAVQRFVRAAAARACCARRRTSAAAGWPWRSPSAALWGGRRRGDAAAGRRHARHGALRRRPEPRGAQLAPEAGMRWRRLAAEHGVPLHRLGVTGGDRLRIRLVGEGATGAAEDRGAGVADELDEPLVELRHAWEAGLPRALGEEEWLAMQQRHDDDAREHLNVRRRRRLRTRPGGVGDRRPGPVRAPAPRPGVGRRRGQRRRRRDGLQGPRPGGAGARGAAHGVAARRPRHRPLPLLHDGLVRSGRTASRRCASARTARSRWATTATWSTPARCWRSCPAAAPAWSAPATRTCSPPCWPRSLARTWWRHSRRCCRASRAPTRWWSWTRRASSACATRTASGRWSSAGCRWSRSWTDTAPARQAGEDAAVAVGAVSPDATAGPPRLGAGLRDGRAGRPRRRVRPRRGAGRDGRARRGGRPALDPLRAGQGAALRLRADLLRAARLVHAGPQPVRGAAPHGRAAGRRGAGRRRPGDAGPGHRRAGRRRVRRGAAASRTARAWSRTATPAARSSSPASRCASAA